MSMTHVGIIIYTKTCNLTWIGAEGGREKGGGGGVGGGRAGGRQGETRERGPRGRGQKQGLEVFPQ